MPTDCLITKIKGDSIILGYRCQQYKLEKTNGIMQYMWIAHGIKAYIPPQYSTNHPSEEDALNNLWLCIPQGVCLLMYTQYSEKNMAGIHIPVTIKAIKVEKK